MTVFQLLPTGSIIFTLSSTKRFWMSNALWEFVYKLILLQEPNIKASHKYGWQLKQLRSPLAPTNSVS